MTIFLSYTREYAAISSFWEYFFKSCGIWVDKKEYEDDQEIPDEIPSLTILNSCRIGKDQYAGFPDHACLVTDSDVSGYKNIISLKEPEGYEKKVISSLLREFPESGRDLKELLILFKSANLWEAGWMYEEFAKENKSRWDNYIIEVCDNVLDTLNKGLSQDHSSEYVQYMQFYCQYIRCGTKYRSLIQRLNNSEALLDAFMPLADKYDRNAMYQYLAGRICELSCVENKQAVYFYQNAAKRIGHSDIFYDIGHSFEKVYGDKEIALHFYKKAYLSDRKNYRAIFKLAAGREVDGKWIEAFNIYGLIVEQLSEIVKDNYKNKNAVSVREIDYLYKVYKRVYYICKRILGLSEIAKNYAEGIADINEHILTSRSFEKLVFCMANEKTRGKEIVEELKYQFKGDCYQ